MDTLASSFLTHCFFLYHVVVVSVSAAYAVGRGFAPRPGDTKDHYKIVQTASLHCTHVLGYEFKVQPNCLKGCIVCGTVYVVMQL